MSETDLLRLLAVPVLAYAAYRDLETRRVPRRLWYPLAGLGLVLLAWDVIAVSDPVARRLLLIRIGLSVGLLAPLGYLFHRAMGFGLADAKALAVIAILFPTYPTYAIGDLTIPLIRPALGVFSLSILADAALIGLLYPAALTVRNALSGHVAPAMVLGRPLTWRDLATTHGKLLEDESGITFSGLDLDALRMYLRWRGLGLADLRESTAELRNPASLPENPNPPTDGAVDPADRPTNDVPPAAPDETNYDDPWGAATFLDSIPGSAYGTTAGSLRDGLDLVATRNTVWIMPGLPFLVPLVIGLLVALIVGDLMIALLGVIGLA